VVIRARKQKDVKRKHRLPFSSAWRRTKNVTTIELEMNAKTLERGSDFSSIRKGRQKLGVSVRGER